MKLRLFTTLGNKKINDKNSVQMKLLLHRDNVFYEIQKKIQTISYHILIYVPQAEKIN